MHASCVCVCVCVLRGIYRPQAAASMTLLSLSVARLVGSTAKAGHREVELGAKNGSVVSSTFKPAHACAIECY